jgi:hypothetical protein
MSRTEIAALACRVLAVAMFAAGAVLAVTFLAQILSVYVATREGMALVGGLLLLILTGVWTVIATYYWQRADRLALGMVDNDPEPVTSVNFTADDVFAAGCRFIGIVMLVMALRLAADAAAVAVFLRIEVQGELLKAGTLAVVGGWSLLGAKGIVRFVSAARRAGTPQRSQAAADAGDLRSETDDVPGLGGRP